MSRLFNHACMPVGKPHLQIRYGLRDIAPGLPGERLEAHGLSINAAQLGSSDCEISAINSTRVNTFFSESWRPKDLWRGLCCPTPGCYLKGNYSPPPHRGEKLSQIRPMAKGWIQARSMGVRHQVRNVPEETIQTASRMATRLASLR